MFKSNAVRGWFVRVGIIGGLAGCGGSASESPWPPEPLDVDLGPAGEQEAHQPERTPAQPREVPAPGASARDAGKSRP